MSQSIAPFEHESATPPTPADARDGPPTVRPRRRAMLGAAAVCLLLLGALTAGVAPRRAQQKRLAAGVATASASIPTVGVARVNPVGASSTVILPGTLQPLRTTAVYARTAGYIRRTLVNIGESVRAGQLLADIDAPDLDQQVMQARAVVAQYRAALTLARAELTRWNALAADGAVTVDELDQRRATFSMATATLGSAQAELGRLLQLQGYERVVAPFAGVVTQRNVDPGALVGTTGGASAALMSGSGSPPGSLFQIARVDTLSVYLSVPEDYSASLRVGTPVVVTVPQFPGDTLHGRVTRTSRSLDPVARTLLTEVDVANHMGAYLPGMYAQAQLTVDQKAVPLNVPATALVIRDGPPQVVVVRADSTVRYQNVQIGRDHGAWVEVTGGLQNGSTIVLNPPDDLRDGARVHIVSTSGGTE